MDLKRSSFSGLPILSATIAIIMAASLSGTSNSLTSPALPGAGGADGAGGAAAERDKGAECL